MQDIVIVGEAVSGERAEVQKALKKLIKQVNTNTFDLAELLFKTKSKHLYTEPTFADFLKTLDLKVRKAQYLERIAEVMDAVHIGREEYEPIGVTKLRVITRLDPTATYTDPITLEGHPMADYIVGLAELASTKTSEELESSVRVLLGETEENILTWLNIRLTKAAKTSTIEPAFEKVRQMLGTKATDSEGMAVEYGDGVCLEAICADFLSGAGTE